jgi:transcriptional regulator
MNERIKIVFKLRERGKTYQEIADLLRISRQRVHQLVTGYSTISQKLRNKIKETRNECEVCGKKKNIEIHHKDRNHKNNSPRNISILFIKHHREIDQVTSY